MLFQARGALHQYLDGLGPRALDQHRAALHLAAQLSNYLWRIQRVPVLRSASLGDRLITRTNVSGYGDRALAGGYTEHIRRRLVLSNDQSLRRERDRGRSHGGRGHTTQGDRDSMEGSGEPLLAVGHYSALAHSTLHALSIHRWRRTQICAYAGRRLRRCRSTQYSGER